MIAPFDLFGKGLYRYTFEGICKECPELKIGDGAVRVFINTNGKNKEAFSTEFLDFMEYLNTTSDNVAKRTSSQRIKKIHEKVKKIKTSEKMGVKYMQLWEEMALAKKEGKEEGRVEGRVEGKIEGYNSKLIELVCKKLRRGIQPEKISEELEEDTSIIQSICEVALPFAPDFEENAVYDAWMKEKTK